jgi:hypothetical protein
VKACVVISGFNPINFADLHEGNQACAFDGQQFERSRQRLGLGEFFLGSTQGEIEARVFEWLQQIIECASFEGP